MKHCPFLVLALAAFLLAGCGYRRGQLRHPQIETIAVNQVDNATDRPWLAALARQKLQRELTVSGAYELAEPATADALLDARVVSYKQSRRGARRVQGVDDDETYTTNVFGLEVIVEYSLRSPNMKKALIDRHQVVGKTEFPYYADLESVRRQAFEIALHDAAEQVVDDVAEAW